MKTDISTPLRHCSVARDTPCLRTSAMPTMVRETATHKVPAIYPLRINAVEGGLLSYGTSNIDLFRRAAPYVDRILRGVKPSELPVQVPFKYEMAINLKTAKALGLAVPLSLQQIADEVIE